MDQTYPSAADDDYDDGLQSVVKLEYSMWMTGCLMMMVYVMYNMCRFAFNCQRRDVLTILIQCLSVASLFIRMLEGIWTLAQADYNQRMLLSFLGRAVFCLAVSFYFFSWVDIFFLIRSQVSQEVLTIESQKRAFNKCEWRLLYLLIGLQVVFTSVGLYNIVYVVSQSSSRGNLPFLVEACLYFAQLVLILIVSGIFIFTVKSQRRAIIWPQVKTELISISVIITVSYLFKVAERIYIYSLNETNTGDQLWYQQLLFFEFTVSELLPIFLWSFFKEPEDIFMAFICNSKSSKFSIFQMEPVSASSEEKNFDVNLRVQRLTRAVDSSG